MLAKDFEHIIRFFECPVNGRPIWLPLVSVTLITPSQNRVSLPLLFDTGASVTTLRADLYPMLGLQSWDQGLRVDIGTAGGMAVAYEYTYSLEILGKTIECPIQLAQMPPNPLFNGLLGRDTVFDQFGFGFWEGVHELYATSTP